LSGVRGGCPWFPVCAAVVSRASFAGIDLIPVLQPGFAAAGRP